MRGVSKRHQPLNIREREPEGTPVPPQAVPFSAALTLTDKTLPGSNTTVIDTMGNYVGGEKPCFHISSTWGVGRGVLGTRSYSHGII